MSRFHVGQQVICIKTKTDGSGTKIRAKEGLKYIINDVKDFVCGCGKNPTVDIGVRDDQSKHYCPKCNKNSFFDDVIWIEESYFAPIEEDSFKQVELTKIKELSPLSAN